MRFMKSGNFIKKLASLALVVVLCSAVFGKAIRSDAIFDASRAVTYQQLASKIEIEDSVLFIGTYIIHKDALTDVLYQKAVDSGSEAGQSTIFYKSELSDGQWFETGNIANGVLGISMDGSPVSVDTINPLYVTYYAGADGILKNARTLAAINPFDIPDPYDLPTLQELEAIRNQYTSSTSETEITQEKYLKNKNSSDQGKLRSDVYYYQLLSTFFALDVRDDQTNKLDQQLNDLNNVYIALKSAGEEDEAALVYGLMEKIDATRRAIVMEKLSQLDENLLNSLYDFCTGSLYTASGNFKDSGSEGITASSDENVRKMQNSLQHDFVSDSGIGGLLGSWFGSLGVSKSSSGWWTVLEEEEEEEEEEDEDEDEDEEGEGKKKNKNPFAADSALLDSIGSAISSCNDSYSVHRAKALADSNDLLEHVIYQYSCEVIDQSSSGGLGGPVKYLKYATNIRDNIVGDQNGELSLLDNSLLSTAAGRYVSAATAGTNSEYAGFSSEGAKKSSLENQKTDEEAQRSMFQYLIDAKVMRDTAPNALEYVNERISITENLLEQIPSDEFKTYSTASVQAHLVWLKDLAKKIIASDDSLKSKLDELKDKKEELQDKRDECLDNNDLAGAKAYDAKIDAVDKDIADEAKKVAKENGSGGSDVDSLADALVDKAISKLADDANADLSGVAKALADVGAEDALNDLLDKATESGASDDTLSGILDAKDSLEEQKNMIDADALLAQLEALFGKSLDEMDERELAIADATVSRLSKMGIAPAKELTRIITNKLVSKRNIYTYRQYDQNSTREYISFLTLSYVTSFRYFYDDDKATGTMTSGTKIYIFKRGSDEMHKESMNTEAEKLSCGTVFQSYLYLAEDDADRYFNCKAEYAYDTKYSVCLTSTMQSAVEEFVEKLLDFFEQ